MTAMTKGNGNFIVLGVFALRSLFIYFSNHWKKWRDKFQPLETIPCKVWFLSGVVSNPWTCVSRHLGSRHSAERDGGSLGVGGSYCERAFGIHRKKRPREQQKWGRS